jgi:hypothetical protein
MINGLLRAQSRPAPVLLMAALNIPIPSSAQLYAQDRIEPAKYGQCKFNETVTVTYRELKCLTFQSSRGSALLVGTSPFGDSATSARLKSRGAFFPGVAE